MASRILVIDGNPKMESLCSALAESVAEGARSVGREVRTFHVARLVFDPILHNAHNPLPPDEPDLARIRDALNWCDHLVLVFPDWWGGPPALLKGFLERLLVPGYAYRFAPGALPERLLKGRSARIVVTMGSPAVLPWLRMRRPTWKRLQLDFLVPCGFSPVRGVTIASAHSADDQTRKQWFDSARSWGAKD